ncbi:hypothetical protein [Candidatus Amarobacter glycogenicus]|nr:hypothetical protein [Dehalococcoidia bacterium]
MDGDLHNAAERIIRRFGGQSALAALLGRRQSTVQHWQPPAASHRNGMGR